MSKTKTDDNFLTFEQRKLDHISHALDDNNQSSDFNFFDKIQLLHEAMPDINFQEICISSTRFGNITENPFFVSAMTAGHKDAIRINSNIIEACLQSNWAMAVGSQRKQLSNAKYDEEWLFLTQKFKNVKVFGNLGISQVITSKIDAIKRLIDSINAQAFVVHCNPLQEALQPEGTPDFKNSWQALENLVNNINIPIIVKETGCGFNIHTIERLSNLGVAAIDLSGMGGTHWGKIEGSRADENSATSKAASVFANWGFSTVECLLMQKNIQLKTEIWASGGVRNGLDAAKSIAMGAKSVGFAKKILHSAVNNVDCVFETMKQIEYELKIAMFCTNNKNIQQLSNTKYLAKFQ